ncbi:hypothetical protein Vretimale_4945, partial [Volvox reticuliferus]
PAITSEWSSNSLQALKSSLWCASCCSSSCCSSSEYSRSSVSAPSSRSSSSSVSNISSPSPSSSSSSSAETTAAGISFLHRFAEGSDAPLALAPAAEAVTAEGKLS